MVLFSKGVFKVYEYSWQSGTLRREIPFVDDISNIVISLDLYWLFPVFSGSFPLSKDGEESFSNTRVDAISYFGETSRKRNTCIIEFRCGGERAFSRLLSSPTMHALTGLTGFKTVQLTFHTGTCLETDAWVLVISNALEPSLGPFTITHEIPACMPPCFQDKHVTFHPPIHPSMRVIECDDDSNNNAPCLEPAS